MVREPKERLRTFDEAGAAPRQAEQLLDWLEGHGCTDLEVSAAGGGVRVRCVCPPGLSLGGGGRVLLWVV
jgi:hypothetical protein